METCRGTELKYWSIVERTYSKMYEKKKKKMYVEVPGIQKLVTSSLFCFSLALNTSFAFNFLFG